VQALLNNKPKSLDYYQVEKQAESTWPEQLSTLTQPLSKLFLRFIPRSVNIWLNWLLQQLIQLGFSTAQTIPGQALTERAVRQLLGFCSS
jgi:hypothetical protein